ncbi:LysR family transcriptional regulator [Amaricoccus solimangrovi]|uniref:LysR family transcriptional regulator n=1 Tax=Amaricoccus solimangrovi TaxID=2589815 RepID=A0A501WQ52_9RHOB|nr:LysR family transcriptional regulator [Amaricoccus solimangrovi]TPE49367.1 LysR family transcriptional regulator [Amaricoccus solimangrovi]
MDQLGLLRLYAAIADHDSLSAVARTLAVSPSTVTLGLRRLEERVGARLLTRTTRRLSFTPEGERFLADCRRILGDLEEAMEAVADRGPLRGEIRVTATNDFGRTRLTPLVDAFMARHPGVRIGILLSDSVVDLAEEGHDIALRVGNLPDSRLTARLLVRGTRRVCAAPAYWDRHGRPRHPRDLVRHNCLVLRRPGAPKATWSFREDGRDFGVRVDGDRAANDGGALRSWAMTGAGVVLKSSFDVEEDIAAARLEAVLDAYAVPEVNLYAVHPAGRRASRRVAAFIDHLAGAL